jgi:3-oxoacyl-[acyl-carrier-protein] synthase-3
MGAIIKATGASTDPTIGSSIAHAALAAQECLANAGVAVGEIDMLINVGIYRDANMVEPAMAALVAKELGLNLDYVKFPTHTKKAALSLDLMNGGCGILNAVQVAGAFLTVHRAQSILIVSSDAHPSGRTGVPGFPYATLGAAMLLQHDASDGRGFGRLQVRDSNDGFLGRQGYLAEDGPTGRDRISVHTDEGYAERLLGLTRDAVRDYVVAERLDLAKTLLVTSQVTPRFGAALAAQLHVDDAATVRLDVGGDPHSSALTLGYHVGQKSGQTQRYGQILFVAAGAGLTTACTIYRR